MIEMAWMRKPIAAKPVLIKFDSNKHSKPTF